MGLYTILLSLLMSGGMGRLMKRQDNTTSTNTVADVDGCLVALTPEVLETIMLVNPDAEECGSEETISCPDAHTHIIDALSEYGWTTCESISYYLSYISLESVSLKYNINVSPGRPGQGTYSMMMPDNLARFVQANPDNEDIPEATKRLVQDELDQDPNFFEPIMVPFDQVPQEDQDRANQLNNFREPLLNPAVAFQPAAWYYSDATTITGCEGSLDKMMDEGGLRDVIGMNCTGIREDAAIDERIRRRNEVLPILQQAFAQQGGNDDDRQVAGNNNGDDNLVDTSGSSTSTTFISVSVIALVGVLV